MKRFLIWISAILMWLTSNAQDFTYDGIVYTVLDPDAKTCSTKAGTLLSGGNQVDGDLSLPEHPIFEGTEYTLTELAYCSFINNNLTSIRIPETVLTIGEMALAGSYDLNLLIIPNSVTTIQRAAFTTSYNLKNVVLPSGLTEIPDHAFEDCRSLYGIRIPASVTSIGNQAFNNTPVILIFEGITPPEIGENNGFKKAYVPNGYLETYLDSKQWVQYADKLYDDFVEVRSLSYVNRSIDAIVGETIDLNSLCIITPENASIKQLLWKGNNSDIAEINDGQTDYPTLKIKAPGTVSIMAYSWDGGVTTSGSFITVNCKYGAVSSVKFDKENINMSIGERTVLSYTLTPVDAVYESVLFTSSNPDVATVSSKTGVVTAVSEGETIIRVTVNGDEQITNTCRVVVSKNYVPVSSVNLSNTEISLLDYDSYKLSATISPEEATDRGIYWSSDNDQIAVVSEDGVVTGVQAGTTIISATSKDNPSLKAYCTVTVNKHGNVCIRVKHAEFGIIQYDYPYKFAPVLRIDPTEGWSVSGVYLNGESVEESESDTWQLPELINDSDLDIVFDKLTNLTDVMRENDLNLFVKDRQVVIIGASVGSLIQISNLSGIIEQKVMVNDNNTVLDLPHGIHIINVENMTFKICI